MKSIWLRRTEHNIIIINFYQSKRLAFCLYHPRKSPTHKKGKRALVCGRGEHTAYTHQRTHNFFRPSISSHSQPIWLRSVVGPVQLMVCGEGITTSITTWRRPPWLWWWWWWRWQHCPIDHLIMFHVSFCWCWHIMCQFLHWMMIMIVVSSDPVYSLTLYYRIYHHSNIHSYYYYHWDMTVTARYQDIRMPILPSYGQQEKAKTGEEDLP